MSTYTDFILALPGETYESFCSGLFRAIEAGQHDSINVHPCEVLPNTILYSQDIQKKFGIKTVRALNQDHVKYDPDNQTYASRLEIIVSTNTMDENDWAKALRLATCVQSFHSFGLLKYIAVYLRKAKNVPYREFYTGLFEWIETDSPFLQLICSEVFASLKNVLSDEGSLCYYDPTFCNAYLYFREGLFLRCIAQLDSFYSETVRYFRRFFDDPSVLDDLLDYQKGKILLPGAPETEVTYAYDWEDYFKNIFNQSYIQPIKRDTFLHAERCSDDNWHDYVYHKIWFGKRENKMIRRFSYISPVGNNASGGNKS